MLLSSSSIVGYWKYWGVGIISPIKQIRLQVDFPKLILLTDAFLVGLLKEPLAVAGEQSTCTIEYLLFLHLSSSPSLLMHLASDLSDIFRSLSPSVRQKLSKEAA